MSLSQGLTGNGGGLLTAAPLDVAYDVKAFGARGDGVTDDTAAIQAAINAAGSSGTVLFPPATYAVNTGPLSIPSGVTFQGYGATITATVAGVTRFFRAVVPTNTILHDVNIVGLTFNGGASSATVIGILIDTTASITAWTQNVVISRCRFISCLVGTAHVGNNSAAFLMTTSLMVERCYFNNCAYGSITSGTYGDQFDSCTYVMTSTGFAAITTEESGLQGINYVVPIRGAANYTTTLVHVTNVDVSNVSPDFVNGSDNGIMLVAFPATVHNVRVMGCSRTPMYLAADNNSLEITATNIGFFYTGGGLILDGSSDNHSGGSVKNLRLEGVGNKANFAQPNQQYPIHCYKGVWTVDGGDCFLPKDPAATYGGQAAAADPPYGVGMSTTAGSLSIINFAWPPSSYTFATGLIHLYSGPLPTFRNCPNVNPAGTRTVAVPATGVAVAADYMDRTFYVTAAAGGCTMTIQGGPAIVIPAATLGTVRVPAGQTVTPTYTNAPTWVVEGE